MHVRPHLDYCDFIFHIPALSNDFSHDINLNYQMLSLESIQYQAALAVTGAWKGTNRDKIYEQLGWESSHNRREFRRLTQFYKIMNDLTPSYLKEPVPNPHVHLFGPRSTNVIPPIFCKNDRYKNSFYPDAIDKWNNVGVEFRSIVSLSLFKSTYLRIIRPPKKEIFGVHNPEGIKRLFQLRVGLSPLKAHMKAHRFKEIQNDTCSCGNGVENTTHFLLECPLFSPKRNNLFVNVSGIWTAFPDQSLPCQVHFLLYGLNSLNNSKNSIILNETIDFIIKTGRFNEENQSMVQ